MTSLRQTSKARWWTMGCPEESWEHSGASCLEGPYSVYLFLPFIIRCLLLTKVEAFFITSDIFMTNLRRIHLLFSQPCSGICWFQLGLWELFYCVLNPSGKADCHFGEAGTWSSSCRIYKACLYHPGLQDRQACDTFLDLRLLWSTGIFNFRGIKT